MSLSQGQGDNLGIARALAMGLQSSRPIVHLIENWGFPRPTLSQGLCTPGRRGLGAVDDASAARTAWLEPWDASLSRLVDILDEDVEADRADRWLKRAAFAIRELAKFALEPHPVLTGQAA